MRGETITYLIDEGRFVALPEPPKQVESIYLVPENNPLAPTPTATPSPFGTKPEFSPSEKNPESPQLEPSPPATTTPLTPDQR